MKKLTQSSEVIYNGDNNYQNAVIEAFRLLSWENTDPKRPRKFDMNLCQYLVIKHGLSCSDCKIEECENHGLDEFR
jgi:hypothetical protein